MNRILVSTLVLFLFFTACQKETSQEAGTPSVGSLQNAAGECMPMNVGGSFMVNKVLNDSNFIEVSVDVVIPGAYHIFTDTVNGYSFKGQGSFANAGPATVKLLGIGKPLVEGTDDFIVYYDSSFCSVSVTVLPEGTNPPPGGSGPCFPLTNNNWWSYDEGSTDTIKTVVSGTTSLAGKTYSRFVTTDEFGDSDTAFYRLEGTNYYRYESTDDYTALGITFPQSYVEVLFLKEGLTTNATWNSDHSGTLTGGIAATVRFKFTCINANASMTVNGKNFTNVYHIQAVPQLGSFGNFADLDTPQNLYYAKGIGLIQMDGSMGEQNIRYWQVN